MPTAWRQGDLVAPERAVELGLITPEQRATHRLLVVSHSCDLASDSEVEPEVELLLATVIAEQQAVAQNGHGIRKLHVCAEGDGRSEWLELTISERRFVPKPALLENDPWTECAIPQQQRNILRRWLTQRYARSEFPDVFITWLSQSGVADRFDRLGKRHSASLVAVYFDLEDESERVDPADPYPLGIQLIYDTSDAAHAETAEGAARELTVIFEQRCRRQGRWHWIELLYCDAIADDVFSLRAANTFRRWRFEHRSVAGEPFEQAE